MRFAAEQFSGQAGAPVRYENQRLDWSWAYDFTHGGTRLLAHDVFTADRQASPPPSAGLEIRARWGAAAGFNEHPHPIS